MKTIWTDTALANLRELHAQGMSDAAIAITLNVSRPTATRGRNKLGLLVNSTAPKLRDPRRGQPLHVEEAHRINEQPWEPMPGMIKLRCVRCRFLFASVPIDDVVKPICPDCALDLTPRPEAVNDQAPDTR